MTAETKTSDWNGRLDSGNFPEFIAKHGIDYIDFGCSKGGSLEFAQKRFGGRKGLGIDVDSAKVERTRHAGFAAVTYDINDIPDKKMVKFVVMSHFLEHIPNHRDVKNYIRKACAISNDFVYIQQPFFDADSHLFTQGYKLFWSDWTGHPNRMTSLELWLVLRDLVREGLCLNYSIHAYKPIEHPSNPCVHPLTSPIDQHEYNSDIHPHKPLTVDFENNVFHELICLITLGDNDHSELLTKLRYHRTLRSPEIRTASHSRHDLS